MSNSSFNPVSLPRFTDIEPSTIPTFIEDQLNKNRQELKTLLSNSHAYTWENLLQPIEIMMDELHKKWAPISHMHGVMETSELRKAYNETQPLITKFGTEVSQNENLYNAISSIANNPDLMNKLDAAQRKIIENDMRDFKLAGIHLPPDKKKQMAELQLKLSALMTKFSENLLDATHGWILHITDVKKLEGLPEQALQLAKDNAKQRGLDGYVLTLDFPSYSTAIRFLKNRELRQTLYEAYNTRASDRGPNAEKWDNTSIMEEILQIRHEIAQIVGFDNYAEYSLATKMAKTPNQVMDFLEELLAKSKPIAKAEYQEVIELAKRDGIKDFSVWDLAYYSEKLRESKFKFSQEDLRPYFPINKVLDGLFTLVNKLYGLTIRKESNIAVWHPDVQFFSVYDENNKLRGGFYIDLYAREHKRDGAWMDECIVRRRFNQDELQYPIAFLTCNFMPAVDNKPALLTHDEVVTLFHEFGHCLQHMLTKVDYPSVSGINGVLWDAVEFPSQFMENYCWEKEPLKLIAGHYQTGEPIPDALFEKMLAAKHFQTGLHMVRQLEFSLFDFRLHLEYNPKKPKQIQSILDEVRAEASVLTLPEFNRFQNTFSHIFAGNYAAGYYSYKWAEVLSSDAYERFEEKGLFDRITGKEFMENILEVGGVIDPMISFVAFRGREPQIDALLRQSGIISK